MFAVNGDWPGKADGDLGYAGEVFDVAFGYVGVEGVVGDVVGFFAGYFFDESLPLFDNGLAVVVVIVAGDANDVCFVADGVFNVENEFAEAFGDDADFEFVDAFFEGLTFGGDFYGLTQGKGEGFGGRNVVGGHGSAVVQFEGQGVVGDFAAVYLDTGDAGQGDVGQAVFYFK